MIDHAGEMSSLVYNLGSLQVRAVFFELRLAERGSCKSQMVVVNCNSPIAYKVT